MVTHCVTSSTTAAAVKRTVGGIEILTPPMVLSFFMLSLPLMKGTLKARV